MLEVRGLRVAYGGINAVKGVDLDVKAGEMVALIGANGAGKTTILKALTGLVTPAAGRIQYNDIEITALPTFRRVELGLALVPEGRGIFGRLSVQENLELGAYHRRRGGDGAIAADLERIYQMFPRLAERRAQAAGTLSGGEQQMLALGRALMSRPQLLLLDEPSMGLAPLMVRQIFETVRAIAREGTTVLLIEQNAQRALEISQRGYVMESGAIVLSGESAQLLADPRVKSAYLGE
ncbi:MAG TPA: ABC transporter ATP-binding protein [Burkholderiales bacterium]|nr:ABC transporter ATP-binding protein [Burkholderiales bacterium]